MYVLQAAIFVCSYAHPHSFCYTYNTDYIYNIHTLLLLAVSMPDTNTTFPNNNAMHRFK